MPFNVFFAALFFLYVPSPSSPFFSIFIDPCDLLQYQSLNLVAVSSEWLVGKVNF